MLKFFRSQKDSWFVKAILILTALSFMSFFGIQGMSEMRMRNRAIISLKGRTITIQEYLNEYNQRVETLRRLMKGDFSAADAENSGLMVKTLNELGSKAVIERLVDQLHLIVTDDEVRQMVQTMPNFQGIDGKFNIGLFNEYLRTIGQSEKHFISEFFFIHPYRKRQRIPDVYFGKGAAYVFTAHRQHTDRDRFTVKDGSF